MSSRSDHLQIRPFRLDDRQEVIRLWERCALVVPQNDPVADIACKLQVQPELFLVGVMKAAVVATVMAGYDGHRGWVNYLAVDPRHRRRGIGRSMMEAAEAKLRKLGCPKINLQVRESNGEVIAFYRQLGYAVDAVVSLGKRLKQTVPSGSPDR
ncbi:MAG: acetyltransferase GCN5 [Deltaproteobacteria bacterium SG8_13]|nr:MAG: acetyltransferase GCN5 [Deltaproteobacteria bacterium SG8_13]